MSKYITVWHLFFVNNERTEGYTLFFETYEAALNATIVDGSGKNYIHERTYEVGEEDSSYDGAIEG